MRYCLSALSEIDARLCDARRILVASDFDGTLSPISDSPAEVHVRPAVLGVLRRVADCERITFAVISGRALADVAHRLPLNVTFAGNHGLEIQGAGFSFEHPAAIALRPDLTAVCAALTLVASEWPGAWVEDKGLSATLHYRKVDPQHQSPLLIAARGCLGKFAGKFALRAGKKALEIRPRVPWDKGFALKFIREQAGPFDLCISIGDDRTDEMMFRANHGQVNIKVGFSQPSDAGYYLSDAAEVGILLSHILDVCEFGAREQTATAGAYYADTVAAAGN